jgi:hypothetical protein
MQHMHNIHFNISLPTIIRLLLWFGCPLFNMHVRKLLDHLPLFIIFTICL